MRFRPCARAFVIDAEWGEMMDQADSGADERAEKSTSLNDVYAGYYTCQTRLSGGRYAE